MANDTNGLGRLVGNIHLSPLPGSPSYGDYGSGMDAIVQSAVADARTYEAAGFDRLIIENAGDWPYIPESDLGPETCAAMAVVADRVREACSLPIGIICVANAVETSLAICVASGGTFVRANQWIGAAVASEGWMNGRAGYWLRYRRRIGGRHVKILADVSVKHAAHAVMADVPLAEQASLAQASGADAIVVTGRATGQEVAFADLREVRGAVDLPIFVGSGVNPESIARLLSVADGVIVGSAAKRDGKWWNEVDAGRARALTRALTHERDGTP